MDGQSPQQLFERVFGDLHNSITHIRGGGDDDQTPITRSNSIDISSLPPRSLPQQQLIPEPRERPPQDEDDESLGPTPYEAFARCVRQAVFYAILVIVAFFIMILLAFVFGRHSRRGVLSTSHTTLPTIVKLEVVFLSIVVIVLLVGFGWQLFKN